MNEYLYSLAADFPLGLASDRLARDIQESAITIAFDHVDTAGDAVSIWFKAALPAPDEALLDTLVAGHSGEPLPQENTPVSIAGLDVTNDSTPRLRVQPVTVDRGLWHWYHSAGDHATNGRAEDQLWILSNNGSVNPVSLEWQYNDWLSMVGGIAMFKNAELGDHVRFKVFCPATTAQSTPGSGNANKVPLGPGINMFVPAASGAWTINLSDRSSVCPVPKGALPGYWDWDWPDAGAGSVLPVLTADGPYALLDFAVNPAIRFIPKVTLLGEGQLSFKPENVKPSDVLPHWKLRCELHHNGLDSHELQFTWHIICARKDTR